MTFGEFLAQLLGWLGEFVAWIFAWVPRRLVINCAHAGVHYPMGDEASRLEPGVHWYVPNRGTIAVHSMQRYVLEVDPMGLETKDGRRIVIGVAITARIQDVLVYEVDNFSPELNLVERAKAALRDMVMEQTWEELSRPAEEGSRLEKMLTRRMSKALADFGIEVLRTAPTDQVRTGGGTMKIFGGHPIVDSNRV